MSSPDLPEPETGPATGAAPGPLPEVLPDVLADSGAAAGAARSAGDGEAVRDIAEVPAAEIISAAAVHLMSAAAVKTGLAEEGERYLDLDEARRLITALAGLVTAARPYLGVHAAPLRDGLQALQRAFREASRVPDAPGEGPGEQLTGPVR